jgi:Ca2+ transporting ATPase
LFQGITCDVFTGDTSKAASTISLSILVVIEMFNALNGLSATSSLLTMPPTVNPMLCFAIALSMALHFMILYVPFFQTLFGILPLGWVEWQAVLYISAPVVLIDEVLKAMERFMYVDQVKAVDHGKTANGRAKHD